MHYHCIFELSVLATVLLDDLAQPLSPHWDDMYIKHSWDTGRPWAARLLVPQSTPTFLSSPSIGYGARLSKEQVTELVAPGPEMLELVIPGTNTTAYPPRMTVARANTLLGASYQPYRHVERGEIIVRTVGYPLSAALHRHALNVMPTTSFVSPRTQRKTTAESLWQGSEVGIGRAGGINVNYVIPEFLPADLTAFIQIYRSEADDAAFTVIRANDGVYNPTRPHGEVNMDIQYAEAMAYPTPHIFYSTCQGASGTDDYLVSFLEYIVDQEDNPQTISILYERLGFIRFMPQPVRVAIFLGWDRCATARPGHSPLRHAFAGPCVTVVGGTTGYEPEVAAYFSGGGFSNYIERPHYQKQACDRLPREPVPRPLQASRFRVLSNGDEIVESGISAAVVSFSSYLGRPSLSTQLITNPWVVRAGPRSASSNPWLYGGGFLVLNDITEGSNPGCGTDGFSSVNGWGTSGDGRGSWNPQLRKNGGDTNVGKENCTTRRR
ncbi:hypothetical protein H4582DRAFT_2055065 [Lactarius indigo]|nr:hypothetical protein H4582DRAFT_2055065 [Lactarius indigo]